MKAFLKQTSAVFIALALTIALITAMSANTFALAGGSAPVGTNGDFFDDEPDTNHCIESEGEGEIDPDWTGVTKPDGSPYYEYYETTTEEPTTGEPTDVWPTLELWAELTFKHSEDGEDRSQTVTMDSDIPFYSPNLYYTVSDWEPSDEPYYVTLDVLSCIFPADPPSYTETVAVYVKEKGDIKFTCYAPNPSLGVSGQGITVKKLEEPTTAPDSEPIETETYPSSLPESWTTTPMIDPTGDRPFEPTTIAAPTEQPSTEATEAPSTPAPQLLTYRYGDVNLDNRISIEDVTAIQKIVAQLITPNEYQSTAADVSGDNKININDATLVQKYNAEIYKNTGRTGQVYLSADY